MSDKSDGADDAAVLLSRKQLAELERDAALGRIFREMLETLAEVEKIHLKTNPRKASDARAAALYSLMCVGKALRDAKCAKLSNLDADYLSWPLFLLAMELFDVENKRPSPLLTAKDPPKGEPGANTANAKSRAAAIVAYERLTECDAWTDHDAASVIAKIFQDRGVKVRSSKSEARRKRHDGTVTPDTVKEWLKQSRATWDGNHTSARLKCEIDAFRKLTDELYQVGGYVRSKEYLSVVSGFYSTEILYFGLAERYAYEGKDRCDLLLAYLRRYIAGIAYEA